MSIGPRITKYAKDECNRIVGETIRAARLERGLSVTKLAAASRLELSSVQRAEEGKAISVFVIGRLAEGLDCIVDELIPLEAVK